MKLINYKIKCNMIKMLLPIKFKELHKQILFNKLILILMIYLMN